MSAVRWAWMTCGLLLAAVTTEGQQLKPPHPYMTFKAEEVHITQSACSHIHSVGNPYGNWKRVMFTPDLTCTGNFRCKLTFRLLDSVPRASDICVDYSRIQIHGRKSSMLIEDDSDNALRDRLTQSRYPLMERYMNGMLCINKNSSLHLTFRADCARPLDQRFVGWMYVFVQSSATGSIYFVDGDARHRHSMSVSGQPLVSLRSHVWTDVPLSSRQTSSLRLSVADFAHVCIEWNPFVTSKFPRGIQVHVYKAYFNMERVESTLLTLSSKNGTLLPWHSHDCYYVRKVYELVIKVTRDSREPVEQPWNETELLFEMIFGVNNEGNRVYGLHTEGTVPETTTRMLDSTTPVDSTGTWKNSLLSFLERHKVKIGLGAAGIVLLLILYYCCHRCYRQQTRAKEPNADSFIHQHTSSPAEVGGGGTGGGGSSSSRRTGRGAGADAIPMMARVTPSAPAWNEIEEHPLRDSDGPPAYADVFPDKV